MHYDHYHCCNSFYYYKFHIIDTFCVKLTLIMITSLVRLCQLLPKPEGKCHGKHVKRIAQHSGSDHSGQGELSLLAEGVLRFATEAAATVYLNASAGSMPVPAERRPRNITEAPSVGVCIIPVLPDPDLTPIQHLQPHEHALLLAIPLLTASVL